MKELKSVTTLRSAGAKSGMTIYLAKSKEKNIPKPKTKPLSSLALAPKLKPMAAAIRQTTPTGKLPPRPPGAAMLRDGAITKMSTPLTFHKQRPSAPVVSTMKLEGSATLPVRNYFPSLKPQSTPPQPINAQEEKPPRPIMNSGVRNPDAEVPVELTALILKYDNFEVYTKLGGSVWKARENLTGMQFAIKKLKGECLTNKQAFYQELMKMYNVEHGCISHIYGFTNNPLAVVYDYYPNGSLDTVLDMELIGDEPANWNNTKKQIVMFGVAEAMKWMHSKRVMHRNLKPANILLDENMWPLIGDIGFTRDYDVDPMYTAPELLQGASYKSKVDVFSFAMIVYHIICGRRPYASNISFSKIKETVIQGGRPKIPESTPASFASLIQRCWHQDPAERPTFATIAEEFASGSYLLPDVDQTEVRKFQRIMATEYEEDKQGRVSDISELAEVGDVHAQLEIAMSYLRGRGVTKDVKEATRYLMMACESGNHRAEFIYAFLFMRFNKNQDKVMKYMKLAADGGDNRAMLTYSKITKDANESKRYLEMAVKAENPSALLMMASSIRKTDPENANKYYKLAADQGSPSAQCHWALALHSGKGGVKIDIQEANKYYAMAAEQGNVRAQCNYASNLQNGEGCEKNLELASKYYKLSSETGDAHAQYGYACTLMKGLGVDEDPVEANRLYKLSAKQGHIGAMFSLGSNLMKGIGIDKDTTEGNHYLKMAADKGDAQAQSTYAHNLISGIGVDVNKEEGTRYYKMAADQGNPRGLAGYAASLQKGIGITANVAEANTYLRKAADAGNASAQYTLASNLENGNGIEKNLEEANRYYKMAADQGNAHAQFSYAMNALKGNGIEQNLDECNKYLAMSAERNNARAQFQYASHLMKGTGIEKDLTLANELLRRSAEQGNPSAQFYLGYNLFNGNGLEKNPEEANKYFKLSADKGHANAQCSLAYSYLNGIGTEKNIENANHYYKLAADAGNAVAQYNYGTHLMNGTGIAANPEEANAYFKKAADQGNSNAQLCLGVNIYNGKGIAKDREAGKALVKKSADAGNRLAIKTMAKFK